jgi:hypothetical protein
MKLISLDSFKLSRSAQKYQSHAPKQPADGQKPISGSCFRLGFTEASEDLGRSGHLSPHNGISKDNLPSAMFTGHAGTGKTHLSRALGYAACQKGLSVLFITAAEMVNHLQHAQKTYNLEEGCCQLFRKGGCRGELLF